MGYNAIGAPRLNSFESAVEWHNKVKPIRGTTTRPLGERRYHNTAHITMPDPDTVQLHYYGNKLVEWFSDNTFVLHAPKYYSAFSGDQIIGFVPRMVGFNWVKGRLFVQLSGSRHIELARGQSLKFVPVDKTPQGNPLFEVENAPDVLAYRVRRGQADAIVEKRFGAFLEWVALTASIVQGITDKEQSESYTQFKTALGYTVEFLDAHEKRVAGLPWEGEREQVIGAINLTHGLPYTPAMRAASFHRPSSELLAAWMEGDNAEHWLCALNVIQDRVAPYAYNRGASPIVVARIRDYVKSITAFLHRDEAFKVVTLTPGTVPSKCNTEYFREIHIDFGQTDTVSECSLT